MAAALAAVLPPRLGTAAEDLNDTGTAGIIMPAAPPQLTSTAAEVPAARTDVPRSPDAGEMEPATMDAAAAAKYQKAAAQGHAWAHTRLGEMYAQGLGVEYNPTLALQELQLAAAAGDMEAQLHLGIMYASGADIAQDEAAARKLLSPIAELDASPSKQSASRVRLVADARYHLLLLDRRATEARMLRSDPALEQAAQRGDVDAQYQLGVAYEESLGMEHSLANASEWYRKAALRNHTQSQVRLGALLLAGDGGVRQDSTEAAHWFEAAAAQGDAQAESSLGYLYLNGIGVTRSLTKAEEWLRKAFAKGLPEAQRLLDDVRRSQEPASLTNSAEATAVGQVADAGKQYATAQVLSGERRFEEAATMYRQAAALGHAEAQTELGNLYLEALGVEQSDAEAATWFAKAAVGGHAQAQCNLGMLHLQGRGSSPSRDRGLSWLQKAAAAGNIEAQYQLQLAAGGPPKLEGYRSATGRLYEVATAAKRQPEAPAAAK
eukprot:gnl/TRDRNA2_/TRDRNA2_193453_c0_seq1.p1 gnl/TRDRNA2_/TRDRNA2_193453_c0~~gnl/TRDRNA2_/TRDRNA2_193453_c0_seq1.p1  ORF type:complete len:530 (+),score=99.52 gnl/TRDRNA2_/TRDRNA2_193453_c0_seq1:115-1590(+)